MKIRRNFILTAIIFLCMASISVADIMVETKIEMDMMGAGKVGIEQIQYVKGDRSYDISITKLTDIMAASVGRKEMKNIQIVRLDKGIGWTLNPDTKSYAEFDIEQMKEQIAQAKQRGKAAAPMIEYDWTTEISKDIGNEKVLDFDCKGIRVISVGTNKNDVKDSVFITNEQWFSEELPRGKEFIEFNDKMAEMIGSDKGLLNQMSMNPMLAKFGNQFGTIAKELESIEGIPLKTVLVVEGTAASMPGAAPQGGHHNFISLTSTVTKIDNNSIDDSRYEIPEGFKKQ